MTPEDAGQEEHTEKHQEKNLAAGFTGPGFSIGLALVFLLFHLPYLPASLEDLDSVNFALGVQRFDVARHQPHPPGYPVFIVLAKAVHAFGPSEPAALALVSIIAGAFGVLAVASLFRRLDGGMRDATWTLGATAVAMTSPLYWFTAARPLSDAAGLAAAVGIQAMTLGAATARGFAAAGFLAGVATGLRSQVAWLTMPLLIVAAATRGSIEPTIGRSSRAAFVPRRLATVFIALIAFIAGFLVWFIPLVVVSGGPAAYAHALFNQGAEDLGNITMLSTTHNARVVAQAGYYAFVAPWATWTVASIVLGCAALGIVQLYRRGGGTFVMLAAAFGPYLLFDLLFQETFTSRYALPLVVPVAYLAVAGLRLFPRSSGLAVAVAVAMFDAHVGGTSIAAYSRQKAPAFRLLDDMAAAAPLLNTPPVLAMDRRNAFDFRRPIAWVGGAMPAIATTLQAPPQHEWLEAVKYWNGGGRAQVWFVVDPMRTSIDLVQHEAPVRYRWPLPYPVLVSGARPNEMDWYRVSRPDWYVEEGWALTPEAAGVAAADRRDLSAGPIVARISPATAGGTLMIGGRSFDPTRRPRLTVAVNRLAVLDDTLMPGAFVRFVRLPLHAPDGAAGGYGTVSVTTTPAAQVAIEQFDVSATRPLLGFGDGWHEQEFNPATGLRWRWLSERGELKIQADPRAIAAGALPLGRSGSVTLHLEGESPSRYFPSGSHLVVRAGGRVVFDRLLSSDFSVDVPLGEMPEAVVLETDRVYVPAERSSRSGDRRHLGLRIFRCEITRAS